MTRIAMLCPMIGSLIFLGIIVIFLFEIMIIRGRSDFDMLTIFFLIFTIIPLVIFVYFLRQFFIVGPRTARKARADREKFLRSARQTGFHGTGSKQDFRKPSMSKTKHCRTCGAPISARERFCSQCGSAA